MLAKKDYRELVKGVNYEHTGIWRDTGNEEFYQVILGDRIVLYHVSHFEPEVYVSDDEF